MMIGKGIIVIKSHQQIIYSVLYNKHSKYYMFEKTFISTDQLSDSCGFSCMRPKQSAMRGSHKAAIPRNSFKRVEQIDYKKKNITSNQLTGSKLQKNKISKRDQFIDSVQKSALADKLLFKKQNMIELNIHSHGATQKENRGYLLKNAKQRGIRHNFVSPQKNKTNLFPEVSNKPLSHSIFGVTSNRSSIKQKKLMELQGNVIDNPRQMKPSLNKTSNQYFQPKNILYFKKKLAENSLQFTQYQKPKKFPNLTTYDHKQLETLHRAMLQYSKGSDKILKKAFLVVLNMEGIVIEQSKLKFLGQQLTQLYNFAKFIQIFKKIETDYFKQSIIDYLEILFKRDNDDYVDSEYILEVFMKRMKEDEAIKLHNLVVQKIRQKFGVLFSKIKLDQFYRVCYGDFRLCQELNKNFIHHENDKE